LITDPVRVALLVAKALEATGLRYLVGGSLASSISGEPRSTLDVDMVVEMKEKDVEPFVEALAGQFHVDVDSLRRAVLTCATANLIHYATSTKVDLFILPGSVFDRRQMDRRQRVQVATDPDGWLYVYTPEDILLQKLRWYRLGNEVSDRQWRDVLAILLVQGDRLDQAYLTEGAKSLGVSDLLQRALGETLGE
jgi:hypothetical protein